MFESCALNSNDDDVEVLAIHKATRDAFYLSVIRDVLRIVTQRQKIVIGGGIRRPLSSKVGMRHILIVGSLTDAW